MTSAAHTLHTRYTRYTHAAHTLHTRCTHAAHTLHTHCTHAAHTLHTRCTHAAHTLHTRYTHATHVLHTLMFVGCPRPIESTSWSCSDLLLQWKCRSHSPAFRVLLMWKCRFYRQSLVSQPSEAWFYFSREHISLYIFFFQRNKRVVGFFFCVSST